MSAGPRIKMWLDPGDESLMLFTSWPVTQLDAFGLRKATVDAFAHFLGNLAECDVARLVDAGAQERDS